MAQKIPLTKGKFAIVDDADYGWLSQWKWWALKVRNKYYAVRSQWLKTEKRYIKVFMHRQIMNPLSGINIDHKNGNSLDNKRKNMRFCDQKGNSQNRSPVGGGTSRYKGVTYFRWGKRRKRWAAKIKTSGKSVSIGYFNTEEEAAKAYDAKARELFGEFAKTNFP